MTRWLTGLLCLWLVGSGTAATWSTLSAARTSHAQASATETVYVTRTGAKYHRAGCRSLAKSSAPMALKDAAQRYGACKVCNPPVWSASSAVPVATPPVESVQPKPAPAAARAQSTRCAATTKKGTQCSRTAKAGSSYCWQHGS